ncbi:MAG: hypothetical protein V2J55_18405 [Candidatus Competibacteraceae bacterium]|jgi:hypothetical protein|nr:hypothetical protein [Candidatus Competibacteraceae bacterium]
MQIILLTLATILLIACSSNQDEMATLLKNAAARSMSEKCKNGVVDKDSPPHDLLIIFDLQTSMLHDANHSISNSLRASSPDQKFTVAFLDWNAEIKHYGLTKKGSIKMYHKNYGICLVNFPEREIIHQNSFDIEIPPEKVIMETKTLKSKDRVLDVDISFKGVTECLKDPECMPRGTEDRLAAYIQRTLQMLRLDNLHGVHGQAEKQFLRSKEFFIQQLQKNCDRGDKGACRSLEARKSK